MRAKLQLLFLSSILQSGFVLPTVHMKFTTPRTEYTPTSKYYATQPPIKFVPGLLPRGYSGRSVRPTIQLHVVTKIKTKWSYTPLHPCAFTAGTEIFANLLLSSEYLTQCSLVENCRRFVGTCLNFYQTRLYNINSPRHENLESSMTATISTRKLARCTAL